MIIQYDEYKTKLNGLRPTLKELGEALRLEDARREIDELEQKTGIDFFCNLSDTIEEQLESKTAADIISAWGL